MSSSMASRAGSLHLVGGALCLDFANTASGRGTDSALEHLQNYQDLLTWCVHSGRLGSGTGRRLAALASDASADAKAVLRRGLDLREAIRDLALALSRQVPPNSVCAAIVANEAAMAIGRTTFVVGNDRAGWDWPDDTDDLARPLWPIARSAFVLLESADRRRLKLCPSPDCGWVFLDRSKNNSRRWCDMRVCGNRDKARRHYRRLVAE